MALEANAPTLRAEDPSAACTPPAWDADTCLPLIDTLAGLRREMLRTEAAMAPRLARLPAGQQASARNLAHYLALRREDRRPLQARLAALGLSSLGRAESHVLANLDKVLGILHRLAGRPWRDRSDEEPVGFHRSRQLLETNTAALLGPPPVGRKVRMMVTLPSTAADDAALARDLVAAGMDVARINCAHDDPARWEAMARHVRAAAEELKRPVRILMDLAGPKLRTGPIEPGPAVLKVKPVRDALGRTTTPAYLGLRPAGSIANVPGAPVHIGVDPHWLDRLRIGDTLGLIDARGSTRRLQVIDRDRSGALLECEQTAYLVPETRIERRRRGGPRITAVADLPRKPGSLPLQRGDLLHLTRSGIGTLAPRTGADAHRYAAAVACTLPEVFDQVRAGERIWFDDGSIGGVIRGASPEGLRIEITHTGPEGGRLGPDKGINLPDSTLDLPALTGKDIADLATVARHADLAGLSFVQRAQDVEMLRERLAALGAAHIGVVLKIETRRAFEHLPELLLAAMAGPASAVMIARGDLAVECGYERLAEVQEEILWAAEAAHMPVIWATQVLETLAKTGQPSRAEITDAAMGERAECVMLNKGPHILDAMRTLDGILRRMQDHQAKKRSLLRALSAWSGVTAARPKSA